MKREISDFIKDILDAIDDIEAPFKGLDFDSFQKGGDFKKILGPPKKKIKKKRKKWIRDKPEGLNQAERLSGFFTDAANASGRFGYLNSYPASSNREGTMR